MFCKFETFVFSEKCKLLAHKVRGKWVMGGLKKSNS
jgi:hypothetical protein